VIGVDVVDIERLRKMMARSPRLAARLFTDAEREYCETKPDPVVHFAGTLAAKEAVMKTLGLGFLPGWARRIEVSRDSTGAPAVRVMGLDPGALSVSISHDGGVAVAVALRSVTH
jgi:holo-[acyl-carrier protein] synthase